MPTHSYFCCWRFSVPDAALHKCCFYRLARTGNGFNCQKQTDSINGELYTNEDIVEEVALYREAHQQFDESCTLSLAEFQQSLANSDTLSIGLYQRYDYQDDFQRRLTSWSVFHLLANTSALSGDFLWDVPDSQVSHVRGSFSLVSTSLWEVGNFWRGSNRVITCTQQQMVSSICQHKDLGRPGSVDTFANSSTPTPHNRSAIGILQANTERHFSDKTQQIKNDRRWRLISQ